MLWLWLHDFLYKFETKHKDDFKKIGKKGKSKSFLCIIVHFYYRLTYRNGYERAHRHITHIKFLIHNQRIKKKKISHCFFSLLLFCRMLFCALFVLLFSLHSANNNNKPKIRLEFIINDKNLFYFYLQFSLVFFSFYSCSAFSLHNSK